MRLGTLIAIAALLALPLAANAQDRRAPEQAPADRAASPFASADPLARELRQQDVYVGRTVRDRVDASSLEEIARQAPPDRPMKIAVLTQLPESGRRYRTRDNYTRALHQYLGLGDGTLIIITRNGISVVTNSLPSSEVGRIVQANAGTVQENPVEGIRRIAESLATGNAASTQNASPGRVETAREPSGGGELLWLVPVGVGGAAAVWFGKKALDKRKAMEQARYPVNRLHSEVVEGISYADNYLDLLPDSEDATQAREARQEAAALLEQASQIDRAASTPEDLGRAQAVLEQAQEAVTRIRHHVDLATGGTGIAAAVEGTDYKATPASSAGEPAFEAAPILPGLRAEDIPENERAACFFCSRPARITDLTPVTIALNGQRRKVLACADDVEIVRHGAMPAVRTVEEEGERVPWYNARRYDPYRDYGRYDPGYAPGYGYGGMGGFMTGMLLGSLLSHPMYAPYPVFMNPSGYATNDPAQSAPDFVPDPGVGSADFFGVPGADFGGDTGGGVFDGAAAGADFGWGDSGGDSGGSDFGSADFGGGDFGGGGDF